MNENMTLLETAVFGVICNLVSAGVTKGVGATFEKIRNRPSHDELKSSRTIRMALQEISTKVSLQLCDAEALKALPNALCSGSADQVFAKVTSLQYSSADNETLIAELAFVLEADLSSLDESQRMAVAGTIFYKVCSAQEKFLSDWLKNSEFAPLEMANQARHRDSKADRADQTQEIIQAFKEHMESIRQPIEMAEPDYPAEDKARLYTEGGADIASSPKSLPIVVSCDELRNDGKHSEARMRLNLFIEENEIENVSEEGWIEIYTLLALLARDEQDFALAVEHYDKAANDFGGSPGSLRAAAAAEMLRARL